MIGEFLQSWPLFHYAYLAGGLIAAMLAAIGVLYVARDQIFVGLAVAQASTFGISVALAIGSVLGMGLQEARMDHFATVLGIVFAVLAAAVTLAGGRPGGDSYESLTGWVYLLSLSGAIVVIANSPLGLNEVYRLLSSSIIGADAKDVGVFSVLAALTLALVAWKRDSLALLVIDRPFAEAAGLHAGAWWTVIALFTGAVLGLAIATAGTLFAFGVLVLPGMVAKNLLPQTRQLFIAAPLIALLACALGFVLANHFDLPPAQVSVLALCAMLLLAWVAKIMRNQFH